MTGGKIIMKVDYICCDFYSLLPISSISSMPTGCTFTPTSFTNSTTILAFITIIHSIEIIDLSS